MEISKTDNQKNRHWKSVLTFWGGTTIDNCVVAFLSDIAGAFDRVFPPFLLSKLREQGLGAKYLRFLTSYLVPRSGYVCVGGKRSSPISLADQVFQITVLVPPLWNVFFKDVMSSIMVPMPGKAFADDLNVFRKFVRHADSHPQ